MKNISSKIISRLVTDEQKLRRVDVCSSISGQLTKQIFVKNCHWRWTWLLDVSKH